MPNPAVSERKLKSKSSPKGSKKGSESPQSERKLKKKRSPRGVDEGAALVTQLFAEAFTTTPLKEEVGAPPSTTQEGLAPPVSSPPSTPFRTCTSCTFQHYASCTTCPRCGVAPNKIKEAGIIEVAEPVSILTNVVEADPAAAEAQCAIALCTTLNRALVPANLRVKQFNFDLDDLVGFDMQLTTVGIVGDGAAAAASAKLFGAFGGTVLSACPEQLKGSEPSNELGEQLELSELLARANIIAVHVDPTSRSKSFVDADFLARMQPRSMLLVSNTALVDMPAALSALQAKSLSHFGAIKGAVAEEVGRGSRALPLTLTPTPTPTPHPTPLTVHLSILTSHYAPLTAHPHPHPHPHPGGQWLPRDAKCAPPARAQPRTHLPHPRRP